MVGVPLYDMYEFWSLIPQKLAAFKKINQSAEGNRVQYWYIINGFTSRSRIFHLYGDVTIAGEGLRPLIREGSLSCYNCCDIGPWFFRSHRKDRPI
jgi:hypothetical protein